MLHVSVPSLFKNTDKEEIFLHHRVCRKKMTSLDFEHSDFKAKEKKIPRILINKWYCLPSSETVVVITGIGHKHEVII